MKYNIINRLKQNLLLSNRLIYIIVGVAFVLRVSMIFIIPTSEDTTNVWPLTRNIVNNLLAGNGYSMDGANPDLFIFPVYPIFLTFIRILHISFFYAKIIQCLIGSLICLVIYHIGKRLFDEKIGLLAGFLWSIYPYSVVHSKALEDSTLMTLLTTMTIFMAIVFMEKKNLLNSILLGLFCGLSIMTRNTFIAFVPFLFIWLVYYLKLKYWRYTAIFVISTSLVIMPWIIRNYIYTGRIALSTHGGGALWSANNSYINSLLKANLNQDYLYKIASVSAPIDHEKEIMLYDEAIDFIKSNPGTFVENIFLRLYYFYGWNYYFRQVPDPPNGYLYPPLSPENIEEIKQEADRVYSQPLYVFRSIMYSISAFPLFVMALGGAFTFSIKSKYNQLVLLFIISFTLVHILSIANIRHRQPIDAIFTLYAANFIFWILSRFKVEK
jgi:4-amino-4-deoxy-L-arabinose transferase-like glycosyltransferase